jgi:hypothetical protein
MSSTVVSHFQFKDDTLFMRVKSWVNVRALRAVLVLFVVVSGLKVNFHKSMLVGVNIAETWLSKADTVFDCSVGKVPFMYLDLPIGGDSRRLSFWEHVIPFCPVYPFDKWFLCSSLILATSLVLLCLVMWHKRNSRIFKAKKLTINQMLKKVKVFSVWWIKTYNVNLGVNSHLWWPSPFVCLDIG